MNLTQDNPLTVRAQDVRHEPKFLYSQLPETSRRRARSAVLDQESRSNSRDLRRSRERATRNVNAVVNDPGHVRGLLRTRGYVRRYRSDVRYFEKVIESNLYEFLSDGTFVTYNPLIVA